MHYDSIGTRITVEVPLQLLSNRDKITLLVKILQDFDDTWENDRQEYELYQSACEVVLKQANKFWGEQR